VRIVIRHSYVPTGKRYAETAVSKGRTPKCEVLQSSRYLQNGKIKDDDCNQPPTKNSTRVVQLKSVSASWIALMVVLKPIESIP
jgi:hypothetical protein